MGSTPVLQVLPQNVFYRSFLKLIFEEGLKGLFSHRRRNDR